MTERKNFTGQITPSIIDSEYRNCNFSQPQPVDLGGGVFVGVRLFPGDDTPRSFTDCNLCNCEVPPGSSVSGGNTAIVQRNLPSNTEAVVIDGESISIEHHKNIVHGRWTPGGYEHKDSPEEYEVD